MSHLFQEIAETIRRRIVAGELRPGDRLPAVRNLAREWRCTPGTVQRAYHLLAQEGLTGGHRGSGTRVLHNRLVTESADLDWASLVNRAEQFLLGSLSSGHTPDQAFSALTVAISRWQTLHDQAPAASRRSRLAPRLRFAGSHDLTVELLAQELQVSEPAGHMDTSFVGSLGGLIALARDEADVAGVHLWDTATATYNLPFILRILPGCRLALVTLSQRQLGLIVPRGNPQHIAKLRDLTRSEVIWMNRQPGSGTRIWLDGQLQQAEIKPDHIRGYDQEGATHMSVAEAVDSGKATAALGIRAAASAYGLNFIPLTEEVYQLVFPQSVWSSPVCRALLKIIRSEQYQMAVNNLGGYNTTQTGAVTWV